MTLYLYKLESLSPKDAFVPSLVESGPAVVERKILQILSIYFIAPWKRVWPFIWTNLISFTQGCLAVVEKILNFPQCFSYFVIKGGVIHLNKLESPLPKDIFWAKFGWSWPCGSLFNFKQIKNIISILKKEVMSFYSLNKRSGIIISFANMFIDLNCFSG